MPIQPDDQHTGLTSSLSIGDKALQFIQDIHHSLPMLERRNAVHKKVDHIAGHKFELTLMKELTKCSQCRQLIWVHGLNCRECKLMIHRKCRQSITATCVVPLKDQADRRLHRHQFNERYFMTPTLCDHCGTLLVGIHTSQGTECTLCKLAVHFRCESLVCFECKPRDLSLVNSNHSGDHSSKTQQLHHESRIKIHDFELVRILGVGSFSKVYLAKLRNNPDEKFAVKVIKKTNIIVCSDPVSAFTEQETLLMGRVYPFLAIAHCCFQSNERLYFVMEYVVGRDLLYHIHKSRKFTEDRAKFYAAEIILALVFLHSRGFIYRDLKLDNIILDEFGHCKLLDFGMSKKLQNSRRTNTFCGTPSYIAPEIIREQEYDYSVDWWSLGVLMYEMIVGCSPFEASNEDEIYKLILDEPVKLPRTLSDRARSILEGFLTKDPHTRLGCQILEGYHLEIKQHPFFTLKSDGRGETREWWDDIEAKRVKPPYRPTSLDLVDGDDADSNCDITLTPIDKRDLEGVSQNDFDGFSYCSESFKSLANLTDLR